MESAESRVDRPDPVTACRAETGPGRRGAGGRNSGTGRRTFNVGLAPSSSAKSCFDKMSPAGRQRKPKPDNGPLRAPGTRRSGRAAGHELCAKIVDWRQLTKLNHLIPKPPAGFSFNPETNGCSTSFCEAATDHRAAVVHRTRTSPDIPVRTAEGRNDSTAFNRRAGQCADLRRIQPNRTAMCLAAMSRHPQLTQALPMRRTFMHDRVRGCSVGSSGGYAVGGAPPPQGRSISVSFTAIGPFGLANQLSNLSGPKPADYYRKYSKPLFQA